MPKLKYLDLNVKLLKHTGMYNLSSDNVYIKFLYYFVWRIFIFCVVTVFVVQIVLDIFIRDRLEFLEIAVNILNTGIYLCVSVRLAYYYIFSDKIKYLVETMNAKFKETTSCELEIITMGKCISFTTNLTIMWTVFTVFTTEFMAFVPLFSTIIYGSPRSQAMASWYPWNWRVSPYYELTFILQIFTNLFMAHGFGIPDMFYVSTTALTAGQFKILGNNFKNSMYTTLLKYGLPKDRVLRFKIEFKKGQTMQFFTRNADVLEIIRSSEYQVLYQEEIKANVEHHKVLIDYCRAMENFFSPILIPILSFGLFYMIFIGFTAVTTKSTSLFITLCEYFLCAVGQLFVMNYFGQELTTATEDLLCQFYESPWYLLPRTNKEVFKIVQMRLGRPVYVKAGKIMILSLETFLMILKTSFSYVAVLHQVTSL